MTISQLAPSPLALPISGRHLQPVATRTSPTPAVYRRRRLVAATLLTALVAVLGVTARDVLAGSGGVPASAAASQPAPSRTIVVGEGDTLWAIAAAHRGDVELTRYLDTLVSINGGASIAPGDVILLP